MSELKNADKPAFPLADTNDTLDVIGKYGGVTKREYFAGIALQGLLATESDTPIGEWNYEFIAATAVKSADALIKELEKPAPDQA